MSKRFNDVRNFFVYNLWDIEKVKNAVKKNWITAEEYEKITGKKFEEE